MVKVCCVKSCKEFWIPNTYLSFFAFPINNEELKEKWLNAAPGYKALSKHSSICSNHFLPDDYTEFAGRRMLKKNAVPSVFGTRCLDASDNVPDSNILNEQACSFFAGMNNTKPQIIHLLRPDDRCDAMIQISPTNFPHLQRDERVSKRVCSVSVQTCPRLSGPSEREKELQHKIKILQNRLRRREKMITNVKDLVAHLKKADKSSDNLEDKFLKKFTRFDLELFKNEANNNNVAKNSKTYTQEMKDFASTLYSYSPRAYKFVRAKINLPHTATLRRWIGESVSSTKLVEIRNGEVESNEIEGVGSGEMEEIESTELEDVEEVESIEGEAVEACEMEELESTETEELESAELEELGSDKMEDIVSNETGELESTELGELESAKMEEIESSETGEVDSIEIEESESIKIEEVESIEEKEGHCTEIEEAESIETGENTGISRLPVLVVLPMSVAETNPCHGTLKRQTMTTIPILSKKRGNNSVGIILKTDV